MRNPFRSEAEAFRFTFFAVGPGSRGRARRHVRRWLGGARRVPRARRWASRSGSIRSRAGAQPEPAIWERGGRPREKRTSSSSRTRRSPGRALVDEIRYRVRGYEAEVLVVAPALNSPLRTWTSDVDGALREAQGAAQLRRSARCWQPASTRRGESATAIRSRRSRTACGRSAPTRSSSRRIRPGRSNWLERDVVARARERFDDPDHPRRRRSRARARAVERVRVEAIRGLRLAPRRGASRPALWTT